MRDICVKIPIRVFAYPPHPMEVCFFSNANGGRQSSPKALEAKLGLACLGDFGDAGAPTVLDEATYHLCDLRACH